MRQDAGRGVREIARGLGASHSTVSRELARNALPDGRYDAGHAGRRARERASRPRAGRLERLPRLRAEVVRRLARRWSPEQVSASLRRGFPGDEELETELVLRSGSRSRRRGRPPAEQRGHRTWAEGPSWPSGRPRPTTARHPAAGGDLVVGASATGFDVYFCDPAAPWQRGANENANGLLGRFFPKGADFSLVTDEAVREAQDQPNGRPRKTLGWSAASTPPDSARS